MSRLKIPPPWLSESELEGKLRKDLGWRDFFKLEGAGFVVRRAPRPEDPVYEIQLILNLGERWHCMGWAWVDALEGRVLQSIRET